MSLGNGTSAGGINAVFLAKALVNNFSLELLRDVWIKQADISRLMRGPTFLPRRLKVPWLAATLPQRSPLLGATFLSWFHDALSHMDIAGPQPWEYGRSYPTGKRCSYSWH